jgi:antitoxin component YwqK of YwqJK toxin-antitoxin module
MKTLSFIILLFHCSLISSQVVLPPRYIECDNWATSTNFKKTNIGEFNSEGFKQGKWITYDLIINPIIHGGYDLDYLKVNDSTVIMMVKYVASYENDTLNGYAQHYISNNCSDSITWVIAESKEFRKGNLTGNWKYYNLNGKIKYEFKRINDSTKNLYEYKNSSDSTIVKMIQEITNGIITKQVINYSNGSPWAEFEYKKGLLWNVTYNYDSRGKPQDIGTFKNGNGILISYSYNGEVDVVENYKDGKLINK